MSVLSSTDIEDNELFSKQDSEFLETMYFTVRNNGENFVIKEGTMNFKVHNTELKSDKGKQSSDNTSSVDSDNTDERTMRQSFEDAILKTNIWSKSEEELLQIKKLSDDIFFAPKEIVSEYETESQVEYKINSWEELSSSLDLSWVEEKNYKCLQTLEEFKNVLKELVKAEYIAVDTETTGLNICDLSWDNPLKDRIVGMSLTWKKNQGVYIPFRHKKFNNLPIGIVLKALKPILEKKKMIGHNLIFDYKVFYDLGIKLNVYMDTMSVLFHIDSTVVSGGKGLKDNIKRIFGIDTLDLETMTGSGRYAAKFDMLDFRTCEVYGCADTDFAFQLFVYLMPFVDTRQYEGLRQDMALIEPLSIMEYHGRRVNTDLLPIYDEINNKDIFTLMDLCFKYVGTYLNLKEGKYEVGRYLFNFNSADELSKVLYTILEIEPLSYSSKSGKPKTDKKVIKTYINMSAEKPDEVLELLIKDDIKSSLWDYDMFYENGELIDCDGDEYLIKYKKISSTKYPIFVLISELRKLIKLKTSFFYKLLNNNYEGKYFTSVSLTAAETHRIIDPIQTIPAYMKKIFIAYDENHTCMDADYAQVEARAFTSLAGDKEMVERLSKPWADYHRECGAVIYGCEPEEITKDQRSDIKVVNFGLPFAMGPKGLVEFRYGIITDEELLKKALVEMAQLADDWKVANHLVQSMLDRYREEAVKICKEPKVLAYFGDRKVGKIYSNIGRSRIFNLDGVVDDDGNIIDKSKMSAIFRQAGNFPIQDFARHLFGQGVVALWGLFKESNLVSVKVPDPNRPLGYRFENKIYLLATVHDEIFLSIDNSINPMFIVDALEKCMMIKIDGHAPYYMGISYCHNWHDGHSGSFELSAGCMLHMLEVERAKGVIPLNVKGTRFDGKDYVKEMLSINYDNMLREQAEELTQLTNIENGDIDIVRLFTNYKNYELKGSFDSIKVDYEKVEKELKDYLTEYKQSLNPVFEKSGNKPDDCIRWASKLIVNYVNHYDNDEISVVCGNQRYNCRFNLC